MVDASEASESNFVTADFIEDSPSKKLVIVGGGSYEESQFGRRLQLKVNMDKKEKRWNPNRDTVKNCIAAWGKDSDDWVGKTLTMTVKEENGRKQVTGMPNAATEGEQESPFKMSEI